MTGQKHLYFDRAEITVRSGKGGNGAVLDLPPRKSGIVLNKNADGDFELPPGGGKGGDVILQVNPALSDLLHLRARTMTDLAAETLFIGDSFCLKFK